MIAFSYFMNAQCWWMRMILYLLVAQGVMRLAVRRYKARMIVAGIFMIVYGIVTWFLTTRLDPSRMFVAQQTPQLASVENNKVAPGKIVLGVVINGKAVAYPVEIIGYHHQVRDVIDRKDILVTYCTACRSGRVFDPVVENKNAQFRLIGMDQYNAIFEDNVTGSWWMQATGQAVAGKAKGTALKEIPAQQVTLQRWLELYPDSKILQADPKFLKKYGQLTGYDEGNVDNEIEHRDATPWQDKSWVAVVEVDGVSRAYDWTTLEQKHIIEDTLHNKAIAITLDLDGKSFYAFERRNGDRQYAFMYDEKLTNALYEVNSKTRWSFEGRCLEGPDSSLQLQSIPVYQEFFHTYKSFRK